jgi:pimeloyl-ACP methyl ester carboxylesterase
LAGRPAIPRPARRPPDPLRARPGDGARRAGAALVLSHGWPDSFWRFSKVIPLLTTDPGGHGADPAGAFDVVVPDMPGYGYSDRPTGPPLGSLAVTGLGADFLLFPADIVRPPRAWLERTTNLVHLTEPSRGGHFAPFEEPELYAQELRDLFRPTGHRPRAEARERPALDAPERPASPSTSRSPGHDGQP